MRFGYSLSAALLVALVPSASFAATYQVGPDKPFKTIQETAGMLQPGDVVEVDGDHTYAGDVWFEDAGAPGMPITVRGVSVNGHRPIIEGIGTAEWHNIVVFFHADHFVFENFEVIGPSNVEDFCLVNKSNDVTLRDLVVHGAAGFGLLGTDEGSGSLTLERSEFYGNGADDHHHQIYMATDETAYPGSVFRMQFSYVHDGNGGNNVKSRSERNEIYSNWIEGAVYHELDLIGPDGQDPSLAREDSDVVGNVLVKHSEWRIARIGGDGTGNTAGRYRFVNNTMILADASDVVIGLQQTVESLEMHNNIVLKPGGGAAHLWNINEQEGADAVFYGSHNWISSGIVDVPAAFTGTLNGTDPGFTDAAAFDFRPIEGAAIVDQGIDATSIASPAFIDPLMAPGNVPPSRLLGTEALRPTDGKVDLGAYEFGTGTTPGPGGSGSTTSGAGAGSSGAGGGDGDGGGDGGCNCSLEDERGASTSAAALFAFGAALVTTRRRRKRATGK